MRLDWRCPVCGSQTATERFPAPAAGTEAGVDPAGFRPSSEQFGRTAGTVLRCRACGHGSLGGLPSSAAVSRAYEDASDPVSLREEPGQVETARRALELVEETIRPGRLVDLGCWTGSFLAAAAARGWEPIGVEPSRWACGRARRRGLDVRRGELTEHGLGEGTFRLVVLGDVLEHLADPARALEVAAQLLESGGALYLTVPDAGSVLARLLGRRWWSVLPMHLQYFTRSSLTRLLATAGFEVRWVRSHAKVFTARYYAERLAGYSHLAGRAMLGGAERLGVADRHVAPDLRDRVAVLAVRRPAT